MSNISEGKAAAGDWNTQNESVAQKEERGKEKEKTKRDEKKTKRKHVEIAKVSHSIIKS